MKSLLFMGRRREASEFLIPMVKEQKEERHTRRPHLSVCNLAAAPLLFVAFSCNSV